MNLETRYTEALKDRALVLDPAQAAIIKRLIQLEKQLVERNQHQDGFFGRLLRRQAANPVRGLYIHGEVGRGKTMLMDLFFDGVDFAPKRRVHFHAFMQEVHARRAQLKTSDVIASIADDIARQAMLLCIDEMQIVDIADAMIIGRLFEALEKLGVCVVTTSNLPPEDLYRDGLNRQLFLPFIAKLRSSLDVIALDGPRDYRLGRIKSHETFMVPLNSDNARQFERLWTDLTDGDLALPVDLDILGRKLHVRLAAHGCARFTFAELCENALGPADYLAITKAFRTVFVEAIPQLKASQRNEAKRFVLMIDTFYDARTRLVATAAVEPESLYPKGQHGFEFKRTVSRLKEMQSAHWWGKVISDT